MIAPFPIALVSALVVIATSPAVHGADDASAEPTEKPAAKRASELVREQRPPRIAAEIAARVTPENSRIVIHLATQRAYLMAGNDVYIDTPISSGKMTGPTPPGTFTIVEKLKQHRSGIYGNFVDRRGQLVRAGVSMKLDAAPAGTHYVDIPTPHFCRLNDAGIGIHGGLLPGYPAAHGSIRIPEDVAKIVFEKVKVGTPVEIRAD